MNFVMSSETLFINIQKASWYVSDGRQDIVHCTNECKI